MIILDENIPDSQQAVLRAWRVRTRRIGLDVGQYGMSDADIIRLLVQLPQPTFFTRDVGFYMQHLCHAEYSIVLLLVNQQEVASFVRRVLRHPKCRTRQQRMGTVLRVSQAGIRRWRLRGELEEVVPWPLQLGRTQ
jgi:hypothetical protein